MENITVVDKKQEWDTLIDSFAHSDFYHTYDYHQIARNKDESPILIKYEEENRAIVIPLLLRPIEGSTHRDATSVYGYPGPLGKNIDPDFDNARFKRHLEGLFTEMEVVSVFSRLNPFVPHQGAILKGLGHTSTCGKVVNIDLTKGLEEQKKDYNRRYRSYINHARNHCRIKRAVTDEEILKYIELYYGNMRRVNATKDYFFERKYFFDLMGSPDFKTEVLLAVYNEMDTIIAGAMFVKRNNVVQYHLSGSDEEYLHVNPIKMLIDEMRILATREGYRYFNLGGGLGSREDSLFRFKSGFSKDHNEFNLWKYIVDQRAYNELAYGNQKKVLDPMDNVYDTFFPYYRRPDQPKVL